MDIILTMAKWSISILVLSCVIAVKCIMNGGKTRVHTDLRGNDELSGNLKIEMRPSFTPGSTEIVYVVTNNGKEDEYIQLNVSDEQGYVRQSRATEFSLPAGSTREIPFRIDVPLTNDTSYESSPDMITVQARGRNSSITKRSIFPPGSDLEYGGHGQPAPFCYDRYVTGNCRYRTDPEYCFNYEWTAYAIIQNLGGLTTLRSNPDGLYVPPIVPGSRERIRVWVKTSCCVPFVEIISSEFFIKNNICVIDVRELQGLHWAEILGIVIGVVLLIIIMIVVAVLLIQKNRAQTILVGHHSRSRECISRE